MQIVYAPGSNPPNLPTYVVVTFNKYIGPSWDQTQPNHVPTPPIQWSNKKQIPLNMAWALTIHKSQGMTLTRSTIDIGNIERQGFTFTIMSHTTTIEGMCIAPSFSFKHYKKMKDIAYVSLRKKEEVCLCSLSLKF